MAGRVWKYGDDVNTDVIIPGRYLHLTEPELLATNAMADLDPSFAAGVESGDVIVAGHNIGCGSSREQAVSCLVAAGVGAIIAGSFARIFYRNGLNLGLPLVVSEEALALFEKGHEVKVDLEGGLVENLSTGDRVRFPPFAGYVKELLEAGGSIPLIRQRLKGRG